GLDLLFAQSEVVPDFVNQRLADRDNQILLAVGLALEGTLEEQDAIRERVSIIPATLGQGRSLVQPEKRPSGFDLHLLEQLSVGLVLDDNRDVDHRVAKASRNRRQRFSDELFEWFSAHGWPPWER